MEQVLKRYSGISVDSIYNQIVKDLLPRGQFSTHIVQSLSMVKEGAMIEAIVIYQKG